MIVAFTENDPVSRLLATAARQFVAEAGDRVRHVLEPPDQSLLNRIHAVLTDNPRMPHVFFGHGGPPPSGLLDQTASSYLDRTHGDLLRDRLVCALCCYGIDVLAEAVEREGGTILGFLGFLRLYDYPPFDEQLRHCLLAGLRLLLTGAPARTARNRIQEEFQALAQGLLSDISLSEVSHKFWAYRTFAHNARSVTVRGKDHQL